MKHFSYYVGNDYAQMSELNRAFEDISIQIKTLNVEIDTLSRALNSLRKRLQQIENG
tara:strand:- start:244 stop:414 length:171 start_codon:yes stop_codon:yes gene_type:complete